MRQLSGVPSHQLFNCAVPSLYHSMPLMVTATPTCTCSSPDKAVNTLVMPYCNEGSSDGGRKKKKRLSDLFVADYNRDISTQAKCLGSDRLNKKIGVMKVKRSEV